MSMAIGQSMCIENYGYLPKLCKFRSPWQILVIFQNAPEGIFTKSTALQTRIYSAMKNMGTSGSLQNRYLKCIFFGYLPTVDLGSVALLWHNEKVLALLESAKFFFAFLDDLGNFKHFEAYLFFRIFNFYTLQSAIVKQRYHIYAFAT